LYSIPVWAQAPQPGSAPATQPGSAAESAAAILVAQQVPGITPDMTLDAVIRAGFSALAGQQLSQADHIFRAALREDPRSATAMVGLGSTYDAQAQQAKKSSDPALAAQTETLTQSAAQYLLAAGVLFKDTGDHGQATRVFQRVLALQPRNHLAQLGLARASAAQGQDIAAIEQFNAFLSNKEAPPDTLAKANLELAQVYRRSRLPFQALEALDRALTRDRENPEIYIEIARTYQDKSELDDARRNAETAIRKAPDKPEYLAILAEILLAQGDLVEASKAALAAIQIGREQSRRNPEDQNLYRALVRYYTVYAQVLQKILLKEEFRSGHTVARVHLAKVIQEQAAVNETLALYQALEVLRRAPAADRRNPLMLEATIEVLSALGLTGQAQTVARQLLQVEPANQTAQRLLQQPAAATAPAKLAVP
jgi:tetratricopeptide (TPR) repeat protein